MCYFASFVLSKNNAFYLETLDSHEDIIQHFNLNDSKISVVRTELTPPESFDDIQDPSKWKFKLYQDSYPDWTYKGDPSLELLSRKALQKRIQEQSIGKLVQVGFAKIAVSGPYGKAIAGDYGQAFSGEKGTSIVGVNGKAVSGPQGTSISKAFGSSFSDYEGTSISDDYGLSVSGCEGTSIVGKSGHAITGNHGKAKAGPFGELNFKTFDNDSSRYRTIVAYVGENGILPDTFYTVKNGNLVISQ